MHTAELREQHRPQLYPFLVGEEEFDAAFSRIEGQDLPYGADPGQTQPGVINHRDGGRGLYFEDPDGHLLEIITGPTAAAANTPPARCGPHRQNLHRQPDRLAASSSMSVFPSDR